MIGPHLLFSPVKYSGEASMVHIGAHHPNPIQVGGRDALSRIISRCHTRSCGRITV